MVDMRTAEASRDMDKRHGLGGFGQDSAGPGAMGQGESSVTCAVASSLATVLLAGHSAGHPHSLAWRNPVKSRGVELAAVPGAQLHPSRPGTWRKLEATGSACSMGPYRATHWLTSRTICCLLLHTYELCSRSLPPAGCAWKVASVKE